tara:strand:+ start:72 stop:620 length:549 start_codon:yes stop_codon:yes gene_type:complete
MSILYTIQLVDKPTVVKVGFSATRETWNNRAGTLRVGTRTKQLKVFEIYSASKIEKYILNHPKFKENRIPSTEWFSFKNSQEKKSFLNLIIRQIRYAKYLYAIVPNENKKAFMERLTFLNTQTPWRSIFADEEREKIDREIIEYNQSSCRYRKMLVNNRKRKEERHKIRDQKIKINRISVAK